MKILLVLPLILLLLANCCQSIEIEGGNGGSVSGSQTDISSGKITADPFQISHPAFQGPRDPSQYNIPTVPFTPPPHSNTNTNAASTSSSLNVPTIGTLSFKMTGDSIGLGTFYKYNSINNPEGTTRLKQSSNNINIGELNSSDLITFIYINSGQDGHLNQTIIASRDHVQFTGASKGASYTEWGRYSNVQDSINNRFSTQRILKDSVYLAQNLNSITDYSVTSPTEKDILKINRSTQYRIDMGIVGSYGFDSKFSNTTISEEYQGAMEVHSRLSSLFSLNEANTTEDWLPCCELLDVPEGVPGDPLAYQEAAS